MKKSASFAVKAICCAFLFGVTITGCSKDSQSEIKTPGQYKSMGNKTKMVKQVKSNKQVLTTEPGDDK